MQLQSTHSGNYDSHDAQSNDCFCVQESLLAVCDLNANLETEDQISVGEHQLSSVLPDAESEGNF